MHRRSVQIITAAALAAFAGQAVAQQQQISPAEGRRISQKLQESNKSLIDAIQLAERETGGKALAAQILTSDAIQGIYGGRMEDDQRRPGERRDIRRPGDEPDRERDGQRQRDQTEQERDRDTDRQRERDRDTDRQRERDRDMDRQPGDRQQQNRDRLTGGQQRGLHASVTCLVNETQLRRVIVDLEEGRVVESRAIGARFGDDDRRLRPGDVSAGDGRQMHLASNIINANVVNAQGDDLGDIDDLALDVTSGKVRYAVLRTGGFLGMGGDRHAVPLDALTFIGDNDVRLNMTEEQLDQREGFDKDRWPQQPTGAWGATGRQGQQPGQQDRPGERQPEAQRPGQQDQQQQMSGTVEKASDVIGATVHGPGDASVGDVDDIVIKPSDSSISHYIIDTDDGKVAVPASEIRMSARRLTLAMDRSEFEQLPRFRDNESPDWTNPQWLRNIEDRLDRDPQRDQREPARRGGG